MDAEEQFTSNLDRGMIGMKTVHLVAEQFRCVAVMM